MRSQLDGVDERLPGSGTFDIKTRATVSIRMDQENVAVRPFSLLFFPFLVESLTPDHDGLISVLRLCVRCRFF
jgi:hypothetical protein